MDVPDRIDLDWHRRTFVRVTCGSCSTPSPQDAVLEERSGAKPRVIALPPDWTLQHDAPLCVTCQGLAECPNCEKMRPTSEIEETDHPHGGRRRACVSCRANFDDIQRERDAKKAKKTKP